MHDIFLGLEATVLNNYLPRRYRISTTFFFMKQFLVNRRIDLVDSRLKYISMITKSLKDYEYLVNCISTFASTRTRVNEQKRLDMREREKAFGTCIFIPPLCAGHTEMLLT